MTADIQTINTLVVGAGQAGIAASEHLSQLGVEHLVLERQRIAQAWRTGRWDSLVANGPAWHDRFPGLEFKGDRDGFPGKDEVADYFEDYVRQIKAPVRTGVEVRRVTRNQGRPGFTVETSEGVIEARNVIAATGPFQVPVIPPIAPAAPADGRLLQIHSAHYHRPRSCPKAPCWWWAQAPRACRLPMNCIARAARCSCRWAPMTGRRAPIAAVISAGGWACWANGMRPLPSPAASM